MPLTHITGGIRAEDIIRSGKVDVADCSIFNEPLAYFFYGRPAYRLANEGAVKVEASCPYCFIFDSALIQRAKNMYAFDTGAFSNRLYQRFMDMEMNVEDFSLQTDITRPNKLIAAAFTSLVPYI